MRREEQNIRSRNKIMLAAKREFALQGYGLSSINTICKEGDISKGVVYHYFKDKDEIFLACISETFDALTKYLREQIEGQTEYSEQLYFDARLSFFKKNPLYQSLFCSAVIFPPPHLKEAICKIKEEFDELNNAVLLKLLKKYQLREGFQLEQTLEIIRLFQDFVNAHFQIAMDSEFDMQTHEEICSRALNILLYGVVNQEVEQHVN